MTDRADSTTEDLDMAADHPAGTAAHQLQDPDILLAQLDTTHTASADIEEAPRHTTLTLLPSQDPMQHQTLIQMRIKQNPEEDPNLPPSSRRSPQLHQRVTWTQMTLAHRSALQYTHKKKVASVQMIQLPEHFIPMTPPPRTLSKPLTGPSMINTNNDNIAANTLQQPKQPSQVHPHPKPVRRALLLPRPTVPTQQNRNRTLISGPPQCHNTRYQHNSTFPGPSQFPGNRFQEHLPRQFHL